MNTDTIILHSHMGLGDQLIISGLIRSFFVNRYKNIYVVTAPLKVNQPTLSHLYEDLEQIKFIDGVQGGNWGHHDIYDLSLQLDCLIFKLGFKWHWYSNSGINACPGDHSRYVKYAGGKNCIFNDKLEYVWPEEGYEYPRKFYSYLDQPYENRYKYFKLPKMRDSGYQLYDKLYPKEKYVLIHNIGSDWTHTHLSINTDYKKIYIEPLTDSLLDWIPLIQNAEEIHCVDSSVFHLVDNISHSLRAKLFYHNSKSHGGTRCNYAENNFIWNVIEYEDKYPKLSWTL